MGLTLIIIGLINLDDAEFSHFYDKTHSAHCSSVKDQTILWAGVGILCLTSFGLMCTFLPYEDGLRVNDENSVLSDSLYRSPPNNADDENNSTLDEHNSSESSDTETIPTISEADEEMNNPVQNAGQKTSRLRGTARLLKLAGKESFYLWLGIAVLLIRLPFSLSIPHFVSTTIGSLIDDDYDGAKRNVLLLFLSGTVDAILDFWVLFLFGYAKENIVKGVRIDTFAAMMRQEQAFFDKTNTGELMSRLSSDCGEMAGDLTWFFRFSVEAVVRITGIAVYMIIRSPYLGLCTVGIVPVVGIINKVYGDWLGKNAKNVQTALANATTSAYESISCIKTVMTSAEEAYECEKYDAKIEKLYSLNISQVIATGIYFMIVSTFLINTVVQAALLLLGSIFVEIGKLTPEVLLAFMLYQGQLQEYTLNLFQSYSSLIKSSGAGDRVFAILDRHPPPPATGNALVKSSDRVTSMNEMVTGQDIAFTDVTFSYPTRKESLALNKLSFHIKSGSVVALVGHSGCGKSTIVSMLERLYDPDEGSITFGGTDLKNINLKAHRSKIGLVTQDPVLFAGTIRENIAYGSVSSPFHEVCEAARVGHAHDFIQSFPNKYDEHVGERGKSLSGGQKQRIAIARAILRKPALLILDEATSSLDPISEAAVQEALNDLLQNRTGLGMTTIVIAHRLQTVRHADSIIVLKNGAVVEQGSHENLIRNQDGHYKNMIDRSDSMGQRHVSSTCRGRRGAVAPLPNADRGFSARFMSKASTDEDEIIDAVGGSGVDDSEHVVVDALIKDDEKPVLQNTSTKTTQTNTANKEEDISMWPQFDDLDKRMMKIALPCIANFAINPLIGAVDLFWVNRMGNALAVAGQAAANQVFSSAFWIVSVLPSVTATLVSKANAKGDEGEVQDAVSQALVAGFYVSLVGSLLMLRYPDKVLSSVLKDGAPALQYAKPYLFIRSFAFLPSLISIIGFSAFRGTLDTKTPLKISLFSNMCNAILDPILMFTMAMGVPGAALATLFAEVVSAGSFLALLLKRRMIRWSKIFRLPSWTALKPLLKGGAALQLRNVALNLTFLAVARVTQSLDDNGVAAAAHALAIQVFQLGGVVLLALSTVAQTVVPNEMIERVDPVTGEKSGGKSAAKSLVNRLMSWGFILGIVLGSLQLVLLPALQKSSPLEEVRQAAVIPSILASVYQIMNGLVFIGEGVMVGCA
ncbi:ABC transporter [Skeletonema marinoi]|uniref:ABC transporter n=1 Tax=Skeletonema marinoi TaxID=267567 RepID=A0AAD8YL04_9STRA|nr:ABC transporter [Skeletonema marinoi]